MPELTDPSSTGYYAAIQLSGNTAEIKNNILQNGMAIGGNHKSIIKKGFKIIENSFINK
jgi:hypothetical protein